MNFGLFVVSRSKGGGPSIAERRYQGSHECIKENGIVVVVATITITAMMVVGPFHDDAKDIIYPQHNIIISPTILR